MPTLQLAGGRSFHLADTLLDVPAERVLRYQCALSPEATDSEAVEEMFQRQLHPPAAGDALGQAAFAAKLAVFEASPQARALVLLVSDVEGQAVTDFSEQALRDRLSYLLTCGLTEAQVAQQHARIHQQLAQLIQPYLFAQPGTEEQEIETALREQRRALACCAAIAGVAPQPPVTQVEAKQLVLDLLEPGAPAGLNSQLREQAFEALCHLLALANPPGSLYAFKPLGSFLAQIQQVQLPGAPA